MRLWVFEAMQFIRSRPKEEADFIYQILTMEEEAKAAFIYAYELIRATDKELSADSPTTSVFPPLRIEGDCGMYVND